MDFISPIYFALGAFACSMVVRFIMVRNAFTVSKPWGISVLVVPLAPLAFRWKYKELARDGKNWRLATSVCAGLFVASGGTGSVTDLQAMLFPQNAPVVAAHETAGDEEDAVEAEDETDSSLKRSEEHAEKTVGAKPTTLPGDFVPPTPINFSTAERLVANQQECARLAEVYEKLKRDRGYLRKGDQAAIEAFNTEAANYQTALAKAKAEQAVLKQRLAKK